MKASLRRKLNAREAAKPKPYPHKKPLTAYEWGVRDGLISKQRPTREYHTAAELSDWWRGWQVGRCQEAAGRQRFVLEANGRHSVSLVATC